MRAFTQRLVAVLAGGFLLETGAFLSAADASNVADTAVSAKSQEIMRLIDQLGSKRFQDREQATRELSKLGCPALPELKKASKNPDAEVRRRAQRLLEQLESPPVRSVEQPLQQRIPNLKIFR